MNSHLTTTNLLQYLFFWQRHRIERNPTGEMNYFTHYSCSFVGLDIKRIKGYKTTCALSHKLHVDLCLWLSLNRNAPCLVHCGPIWFCLACPGASLVFAWHQLAKRGLIRWMTNSWNPVFCHVLWLWCSCDELLTREPAAAGKSSLRYWMKCVCIRDCKISGM